MKQAAYQQQLSDQLKRSWQIVAPSWSLKNIIATNPLHGFEHETFEHALYNVPGYFSADRLPPQLEAINRQTIKWLEVLYDTGQAVIVAPYSQRSVLARFLALALFDKQLHNNSKANIDWLKSLPQESLEIIALCLEKLAVPADKRELFFQLLLTTLSGWASYSASGSEHNKSDYMALRLIITVLLWPEAVDLLVWYKKAKAAVGQEHVAAQYAQIVEREKSYRKKLLEKLTMHNHVVHKKGPYDAQFLFCIDVRSEPIRLLIEKIGNYQTFGCAGFFGLPITVENSVKNTEYAACPPVLTPVHKVQEKPVYTDKSMFKAIYDSVKYTFTAPLALVETVGLLFGIAVFARTFLAAFLRPYTTAPQRQDDTSVTHISDDEQGHFAEQLLRTIGLTKDFSPLVVLFGHESSTTNNIHATALDCGACAGHSGAPNARAIVHMLNNNQVREYVKQRGIVIPDDTVFVAGVHITTTDKFTFFMNSSVIPVQGRIAAVQRDLALVTEKNAQWRLSNLGAPATDKATQAVATRAADWAQLRPEWGLSRNGSLIIGPRSFSAHASLAGRSFLHSYDYLQDPDGSILAQIFAGPAIVAHWICSQYFFSTFEPVLFGSGQKMTANVTGKCGVMQGNASDLMTGLPFESVYQSDSVHYHEPLRLLIVVYAPPAHIMRALSSVSLLTQLVRNQWLTIISLDPNTLQVAQLKSDEQWSVTKES